MATGEVKWYNADKGYGFITREDGGDVHVHSSALPPGVTSLKPGQRVAFDIMDDRRGESALNVQLLEARPSVATAPRKPADELVVIVEEVIKALDQASGTLRRGKYPDRGQGHMVATLLRAVADQLDSGVVGSISSPGARAGARTAASVRAGDGPLRATAAAQADNGATNDHGSEDMDGAGLVPLSVFLADEAAHREVRIAVEEYLEAMDLEVIEDNEPIIGSWWWTAKAKRRSSEAVEGLPVLAETTAWGAARSRQAANNLTNSQAAVNLLNALVASGPGVICIGSLLAVYDGSRSIIISLSAAQVNELERRPGLLRSPDSILEYLNFFAQDAIRPE